MINDHLCNKKVKGIKLHYHNNNLAFLLTKDVKKTYHVMTNDEYSGSSVAFLICCDKRQIFRICCGKWQILQQKLIYGFRHLFQYFYPYNIIHVGWYLVLLWMPNLFDLLRHQFLTVIWKWTKSVMTNGCTSK